MSDLNLPVIGQSGWGDEVLAAFETLNADKLDAAVANGTYIAVVDAGTDLSTARPAGAVSVLWRFDAGVDVGTDGANVVNAEVGDLYFVATA